MEKLRLQLANGITLHVIEAVFGVSSYRVLLKVKATKESHGPFALSPSEGLEAARGFRKEARVAMDEWLEKNAATAQKALEMLRARPEVWNKLERRTRGQRR